MFSTHLNSPWNNRTSLLESGKDVLSTSLVIVMEGSQGELEKTHQPITKPTRKTALQLAAKVNWLKNTHGCYRSSIYCWTLLHKHILHSFMLISCPFPLHLLTQQFPGFRTHWEALVPFLLENKQAWGALVTPLSTIFLGIKDGTGNMIFIKTTWYLP